MSLNGFARDTAGVLQVLVILLAVGGVAFRATYYWALPVAPGASYGIGDVIDLLFAFMVLVTSGLCTALGLVLLAFPGRDGRSGACRAILVGVGSFVGFLFLHNAVPRLM